MDKQFLKEKLKGFGSSDAGIIIAYAKTGQLSTSLHRRIAEIKGQVDRKSFTSMFTDLGNMVEEDFHNHLLEHDPATENNPKNYLQGKDYENFTVSHHIDYRYTESRLNDNYGDCWVELKSVKKDKEDEDLVQKTFLKYLPQLAWHWMISKSVNPDSELMLQVYDTTDCYLNHNNYSFDEFNIETKEITVDYVKNEVELIAKGLEMLDELWDDIPEFEDSETIDMDFEEYSANEDLVSLNELIKAKNSIEERIAKAKEGLMSSIKENKASGIKVQNVFTISYAGPSVAARLDKKKVEELIGSKINDCYSQSKRKESLRISLAK